MLKPFPTPIEYEEGIDYYLVKLTEPWFTPLRPLEQSESKALIESGYYIYLFNVLHNRFIEVQLNYLDFENAFKMNFSNGIGNTHSSVLLNANRLCKNLVMSWRSCIDLMDKKLSNTFMIDTLKLEQYKKKKGELYDSNFEYRFLNVLRNVGAHVESMIDTMHVNKDKLNPIFVSENLIKTGEFKKAILTRDLSLKGSHFDVVPILKRGLELLEELVLFVINCWKETFLVHAERIMTIVKEHQDGHIGYLKTDDRGKSIAQRIPVDYCLGIIDHYSSH